MPKAKTKGIKQKEENMNLLKAGSHHPAQTECGFNQRCDINRAKNNIDLFLCSVIFFLPTITI